MLSEKGHLVMYLPRNLPLCEPHVATWVGESGRRYDFAVSRPATSWLDEAAVFLLVKREGEQTTVLYIGHTCNLHERFGRASDRCPEIWRRALAAGMTHVHLRFEACSDRERQSEVNDLRTALQPSIDEVFPADEEQRPDTAVWSAPSDANDVLVPYRARLKPTRLRDPHLDIEAFDEDAQGGNLPLGHGFEAPRALRSDPAREVPFDLEVVFGERATAVDKESVDQDSTPRLPASVAIAPALRLITEAAEAPPMQTHRSSPPDVTEVVEVRVTVPPVSTNPQAPMATADTGALPSEPKSPGGTKERNAGSRLARMVAGGMRWLGTFGVSRAGANAIPDNEREPQISARTEPPATDAGHEKPAPARLVEARSEMETSAPEASAMVNEADVALVVKLSGDAASVFLPDALDADHADAAPAAASAEPISVEADHPGEAPEAVKCSLALHPTSPLVLFAGEVSYESGADILADAIVTVCGSDTSAQFVFAGEGALRSTLQDRLMHAGIGNRCRLIGDVPSDRFKQLLKACDFVVIPSRVEQGEELARLALSYGRPALVTHQSGIRCIVHGENGLITYDNPGSFVWGIREMLGPLYGKLSGRHAQAA